MGASSRHASKSGQRFGLTLRGLRYLDHPKNSQELVGTVVPWSSIRVRSMHHTLSATVVDETGKALGTWWRPVAWAVPYSQWRAMRWVVNRAERSLLDHRTFDVRDVDRERRVIVWVFRVALALTLANVGMSVWYFALPSGSPALAAFAQQGFHAASFPMFAAQFGLVALLISGRARVNVAAVRVFSEGIEAEMIDGCHELVRWVDIRRIRRGAMGPFVVDGTIGPRLRLMAGRAEFVLRDWMERVGGEPTEKQKLRGMLIRSAVLCQLGGVVGAVLIARFGGLGHQTPLGFYLSAGFLLPLYLVFAARYDAMIGHVARWKMRGRAGKRRQAEELPATSAAE